jgi:hypothetical protein
MFTVDDATAEAIRRAVDESGELAGVIEFRRHFPLIADNEQAKRCVRVIAGWKPPPKPAGAVRHRHPGAELVRTDLTADDVQCLARSRPSTRRLDGGSRGA